MKRKTMKKKTMKKKTTRLDIDLIDWILFLNIVTKSPREKINPEDNSKNIGHYYHEKIGRKHCVMQVIGKNGESKEVLSAGTKKALLPLVIAMEEEIKGNSNNK